MTSESGQPAAPVRVTTRLPLGVAAWLGCVLYASRFAAWGWIPHDEGTIGQSAERVLAGQLPHRDFDDVYTGGLTYLHAAAMKFLGVNLVTPRLVLLCFFACFTAAVYAIARRLTTRGGAIVVTLLVTAWSVPNYFVSLPSWYNLFFATFGVLALLRYLESNRRLWLVLAGACGGVSVLFKIVGVFYIVGGLLFLAYVEQQGAHPDRPGAKRTPLFWLVVALPSAVFVAVLSVLVGSRFGAPEIVTFVTPTLAVCALVVWQERTHGRGRFLARLARLLSLIGPFLTGAIAPMVLFVAMYWLQGAVADLIEGVFLLPQRRLAESSMSVPPLATLFLAAPYAVLLVSGRRGPIRHERLLAGGVTGVFALSLAFATHLLVYRGIWDFARAMPLLLACIGVWTLVSPGAGQTAPANQRLFLVIVMATMMALIQFPYAAPIYFCYALPITILGLAALVSSQAHPATWIHGSVAVFFLVFAVAFTNGSNPGVVGFSYGPYRADGQLTLERGGLHVPADEARMYEEIVRLVRAHVTDGTIYSGPDCPEVYFLAGLPNPTRAIFDFLSPETENAHWMNALLATGRIHAAVVNMTPLFSPPLDAEASAVLERRFPSEQKIGHFMVRFE